MSKLDSVVIVGGGLAGANAAIKLRELGYGGQVTLVGDEQLPPYERPPLSKGYLRGEEPLEKAYVRPAKDYQELDVELVRSPAVTLDTERRRVKLANGLILAYDALLLATGAAPRTLDVPGADAAGILYLRNAADADAIRDAAGTAESIVVVGGGWIGSEVAASLRQLGHDVTLVTPTPRPLELVLGPQVAEAYRRVHLDNGVRIVEGMATEIRVERRSRAIRLDDGRSITGDLIVAGVGSAPRIALAAAAGLELRNGGVAVDDRLRTSAPAVFAAGDIATAWHPRLGAHVRVEHWDNAIHQGAAAAANILGADEAYERTPYFYSDQFDLGMEYRGYAPRWDDVVIRGDLDAREFDAFWLVDGRVAAAMNANRWDDAAELQALVDGQVAADPAALADPDTTLGAAA